MSDLPITDHRFSSSDIIEAMYKVFLRRNPDALGKATWIEFLNEGNGVASLLEKFLSSPGYKRRMKATKLAPTESRFWHYDACFDAVELIRRHVAPDRKPLPGHRVNYFGVNIPTKFFPALIREGVEETTLPNNWHADIAEFGAALRAVELANKTFTVAELGCGWGCWMNITGVVARRAGLDVHLIGVEGDPSRIAYAQEALKTNGFRPDQYTLHHGIAAANPGVALFPKRPGAMGMAPIFQAEGEAQAAANTSGDYNVLPIVPASTLAEGHERLDLLHLDIQGGEADLLESVPSFLNEKVAFLLVGTHSRSIEGRLCDYLLGQGWRLEIERAAINRLGGEKPKIVCDGVQGWRNPRLLPFR